MTPRDSHAGAARVALHATPSPRRPWKRPLPVLTLGMLAPVLFVLLVWFLSSFYFLGDLGRFSDDWSLDLRRPDGAYHWPDSPFDRWNYFWRPLHLLLIHALATVAWDTAWIRHAPGAILHLVCAAALFRLMRTAGVRVAIAGSAATLLLTHPVVYEAVLWPSTVSVLVATPATFWMWTRAQRVGLGQHTVRRPWLSPFFWGAFTFMIACFYEQPTAGACLAGLLACAPRTHSPAGGPEQERPASTGQGAAVRFTKAAALFSLGPALACLAYVALLVSTAPADVRGGSSTFKDPLHAVAALWRALSHAGSSMAGPRLLAAASGIGTEGDSGIGASGAIGAIRHGVVRLHDDGMLIPVLAALGALAGCILVRTLRQTSGRSTPAPARQAVSGAWARRRLVLVLLAAGVLALVPTALTSPNLPQPRLLYFPLACWLGAAAAACEEVARASRPRIRSACGLVLGTLVLIGASVGAVALVGYQDHYRLRARADTDQLKQLITLVPDPAPGTVFMPLVAPRVLQTGAPGFDRAFPSALGLPWASWAWAQSADGYRRRDVFCTHVRTGRAESYTDFDDQGGGGFVYRPRWATPPPWVPRGPQRVSWGSCIPFTVGVDGRVRLVHTLRVLIYESSADGRRVVRELVIRPAQVQTRRAALDEDDTCEEVWIWKKLTRENTPATPAEP